jgi:hypothetical protein
MQNITIYINRLVDMLIGKPSLGYDGNTNVKLSQFGGKLLQGCWLNKTCQAEQVI